MRKIISLLLSFTMIFVLAACGRSDSTESQEKIQSVAQETEESSELSKTMTEVEKQETEKKLNAETEPSESVSASEGEQEIFGTKKVSFFCYYEIARLS